MTGIAIRVGHPCPERSRRIIKLYHVGRLQQRHDTLSGNGVELFSARFFRGGARLSDRESHRFRYPFAPSGD